MIELIMLAVLGSLLSDSDELEKFQSITDELFIKLKDMEKKFEISKDIKDKKEKVLNKLYSEWSKLDKERKLKNNTETRQQFFEFKYTEVRNLWNVEKNNLRDITKEHIEIKNQLDTAKVLYEKSVKDFNNLLRANEANEATQKKSNVSITLSKSCQKMIEFGLDTECPTYRVLFKLYDNTDDTVSGKMVDYGYDLHRVDVMNKHWKFYEDGGDAYNLIMVDPDADYQFNSVNIEIQPNNFVTLSPVGSNHAISYNKGSFTTWHNFKVDENCKQIMIAPNMALIKQAVAFAQNDCSGEMETSPVTVTKILPPFDVRNWKDSPALTYQDWLKQAIKNNKGYMIGK